MSKIETNAALVLSWESVERVRLLTLPVGHAWRADGLDEAHVVEFAGALDTMPPIVVNRRDMTVVDGAHRVAAARKRGANSLGVEWFDGTALEAFHEFLRRNEDHGRGVAVADRVLGVRRALRLEPGWSDRRIAHLCGVSPKRVARIRGDHEGSGIERRVGRDGRARPVHPRAMRRQIADALESDPGASLRAIAARLGVSPETVRSVRKELEGAVSNVPATRSRAPLDPEKQAPLGHRPPATAPWRHDRAFHSTEEGQSFVEWFDSTSVTGCEGWLEEVPLSRVYEIADEARRRVAFWSKFADDLECRTRNRR